MNEALWIYAAWYAVSRLFVLARWSLNALAAALGVVAMCLSPDAKLDNDMTYAITDCVVYTLAFPLHLIPVVGEYMEWRLRGAFRQVLATRAKRA